MKGILVLGIAFVLGPAAIGCARDAPIGGGCEGCELMYEGMPTDLTPRATVAGEGEPGEPMELSGVVYRVDGTTPAPGVILYVYQADATGRYTPAPGQVHGRRHGRLRGWAKTDESGRYEIRTIRPAPYPDDRIPAHLHPIVKEPGKPEYYLDEFVFDDDPLLTPEGRRRLEGRGGSGIVTLARGPDGRWTGRRDIVLGKNIPDDR